jgi:carboxylesterase
VLGLSMGGLFTLDLAERFSVEKIVLYAPALIYKKKSSGWGCLILPFKKRLPWQGACHFEGGTEKYIVGYPSISVKASVEMIKLQRRVKKNLQKITSPLLVVQGKKDQQVNPKVPYYLTKKISSAVKEIVFLPKSDHIIPLDCQKDEAFAATVAFLKEPLA